MKVTLAGYNIDKKLIEHIPDQEAATPETISAAYARISRDPRDVHELREEALKQVKKSRKSNQAIVFGMSHHSVAEHAYFNFDILDISRLALEELEARRIGAAYTEKSQRYITLDGDFVIPKEFDPNDRKSFRQLIEQQNKFYLSNLEELTKYQFKQNPELAEKAFDSLTKGISNKMNRAKNSLEGWAKEDARYVLSLATQGQLGLSFNARTLEHAIRIMRHSELAEVRELSQKLFDSVKTVAPSLIILSDPDEFKKAFKNDLKDCHFRFTKRHLREIVEAKIKKYINDSTDQKQDIIESGDTKLLRENVIDKDILIALFHNNSLLSYEESDKIASKILENPEQAKAFYTETLKFISEFDTLPREFEFSGNLKFELTISASNFAQMKRHRLMTLLAQDYNPKLGYTIPESIKAIDKALDLKEICDQSSDLYHKFSAKYGKAAEYCLTNAHRRRILISVNPRELYHLSRLREDEHAQWDIKNTTKNMLQLAKQVAPLTFILSGGKDEFGRLSQSNY